MSAINTGNNLIYLITAAFLSILGVSGFFGKSNITRAAVAVDMPSEIYANGTFLLKVRLENKRRYLPLFLIRVRAEVGETLFPYVAAGASDEKYLTLTAGQRGRHFLDLVTVSSAFPFNFFIRFRRIKVDAEYIVFPEPKKCSLSDFPGRERSSRGEAASGRAGYEGDLLSLRNYAHGDPMKYIHWKASAKSKELKTKELSSLTQQPVVIDFEKTGIRNREERISCVTYLLLRLYRQNIPAGLRIKETVFAPGTSASHKTAMIRELALYGEEHAAA